MVACHFWQEFWSTSIGWGSFLLSLLLFLLPFQKWTHFGVLESFFIHSRLQQFGVISFNLKQTLAKELLIELSLQYNIPLSFRITRVRLSGLYNACYLLYISFACIITAIEKNSKLLAVVTHFSNISNDWVSRLNKITLSKITLVLGQLQLGSTLSIK